MDPTKRRERDRARFWAAVHPEPTSGCWLWSGCIDARGYGKLSVNGKPMAAHRLAHLLLIGPLVEGLTIDHKCHTPSCVNPDHLEQVPLVVNLARRRRAGALFRNFKYERIPGTKRWRRTA